MKEGEQNIVRQFPAGLEPQDRLLLEMLVTDEDTGEAQTFLADRGICISEGENPLRLCKSWFKEIRRREQGKLQIRFSDKGPTIDINA